MPVTTNFHVTSDPLQTSDPRHVTQAITGLQKEVSLVRREAFQVVAHVGSKVTNLEGTVGAMDAKVDVVATCCQTMQGAAAASQHLAFTAASHPVMATHLAGGASSGPSLSRAQLQHLFTFGKKNSALKVCPCHCVAFAHALQLHMPLLSCLQDCLAWKTVFVICIQWILHVRRQLMASLLSWLASRQLMAVYFQNSAFGQKLLLLHHPQPCTERPSTL